MIDIQKYLKTEAIEDLLDEYDLMIANLQSEIALKNLRIGMVEEKLKEHKPANVKMVGRMRVMEFKKAILHFELKKITYLHYQDGLQEKLKNVKRQKNEHPVVPGTQHNSNPGYGLFASDSAKH